MKFFIPCTPPKTTAQSQKKVAIVNGHARMFTKPKGKQIEAELLTLLRPYAPSEPLHGPLQLDVTYRWNWNMSDPKRLRAQGRAWHDKKPDCSNLIKQIEDAMTRLNFWIDDAQIVDLRFQKQRGDNAGIGIEITQLT